MPIGVTDSVLTTIRVGGTGGLKSEENISTRAICMFLLDFDFLRMIPREILSWRSQMTRTSKGTCFQPLR